MQLIVQPTTIVCMLAFLFIQNTGLAQAPAVRENSLANWPAFLNGGLHRDLSTDLPLEWSPGKEVWRLDLKGTGQSSPIAWGDSIYVTTIDGPKKEQCIVTSIDARSGKKNWEASVASTAPVENSYYVSRAAPTPVCDATGVFAFFESGDVVSLSNDGTEKWKRSLTQSYGAFKNEFGLGSSVAQSATAIFILVDHASESYLVSLDKGDGRTLWKADRGERGQSYASPVCWPIEDRHQVVVSSAGSIDGYDSQTGKLLWSFTDVGGNTGATPILHSDGRFLISSRMAAGAGGPRGPRPTPGAPPASTDKTAGERPLKAGEPSAPQPSLDNGKAAKSNMLAQLGTSATDFLPNVQWISTKAKGSLCSPILHNGFAYFLSTPGVVYCVDATSGELCYEKRLPCGACWATPIVSGNRIYFFGNRGGTTVLEIGRDYKELASNNRLWVPAENESPMAGREGPTHYATIAWNDALIMRTGETVFCFRSQ